MRYAGLIAGAALIAAGCEAPAGRAITGYVEGDYVYVAAPEGGWVTEMLTKRGAQVKVGDPLFTLDATAQLAQRDLAKAQLNQAQAQLDDLRKGRRPDEIEAIEATLTQAKANEDFAANDYRRAVELQQKGFAAQAFVDSKRAARDATAARVKEIQANLELAREGGRADAIAAATANVAAARAALERAEYALSERRVTAKVAARVEDTLRRAGEYVPPGGAVVSLLPPGNIKVRFFVPETQRATFAVGREIGIGCDGCAKDLKARVTFVSAGAEYTPPVIYSVDSRDKLVWLVEAAPEGATLNLSPGQPVDIVVP